MNPNLDHGQAIPNKSPGRGVGIIDTHRLAKLVSFLGFLTASGRWSDEKRTGLQDWFSHYLNWLLTSKNGREERTQGNNHSTWWAAQVTAFATFADKDSILSEIWQYSRDYLLENQIAEDGSFPLEITRTRSFDYSIFNLNAFTLLFRIAQEKGIDLWRAKNQNNASILTSVSYLYPYIEKPETWPGQQITAYTEREPVALLFAGEYLQEQKYIDLYKSLRVRRTPEESPGFDPFVLLVNLYSCTF